MQSNPTQSIDACDVVLVSCYELGHEPLGVLTPAGVIERAGLNARVVDVAMDDFDPASVNDVPLVAISTPMHTALRLGTRVAARVRELNPGAHICFFGLYAELHRGHLLGSLADSCLGAEFENDLLMLTRAIRDRGPVPARSISPAAPREAHATRERALDLAPRRAPVSGATRYARLHHQGEFLATGYVAATRGCKHLCMHCPIPAAYDGRFYALPVEQVLADLDAVVAHGARHITFADADFLNGPTHALRIAREMHRRHPGVTFDYTAKIEHLLQHPGVVDELQSLGNIFVVSAVESFNDDVLMKLAKGHTVRDAITVIRAFHARGLTLRPSLMPFNPWETRESLARLFEIVAEEELVPCIDPVQYTIRLLLPAGSLLLREPDVAALAGPFDSERFTHSWRHPDPAMDAIQEELAAMASESVAAPASETFLRMAAVAAPGRVLRISGHRGVSPRLTEDWFC
ncbi:MAG TPA: CUAEP/CCAEP-tail radical SAM protein [Candidatus Krumholzibacteria bacterium]|nr:CUAEP/CCAEP-tail radical SAM protein [Candidatus Krumholzibacteria bacterium]